MTFPPLTLEDLDAKRASIKFRILDNDPRGLDTPANVVADRAWTYLSQLMVNHPHDTHDAHYEIYTFMQLIGPRPLCPDCNGKGYYYIGRCIQTDEIVQGDCGCNHITTPSHQFYW